MRHAGMHWPANAGGEHPNRETIYTLPGVEDGALLICADSARWWYNEAMARCPLVVWRGLPRPERLPAKLDWNFRRVADEVLNLWGERTHDYPEEHFLPLNELQFFKENGADFPGYGEMAKLLRGLRMELRQRLPPSVKLMFPGWVPTDDLDHIGDWAHEAGQWDTICLHAYNNAGDIQGRYDAYRGHFPNTPIFVGEWNANHTGADEQAMLETWAAIAARDPLFMGAAYYIWETNNGGENDLSVWGNGSRLALFQDPPRVPSIEPPVEEPVPEPTGGPPDPWRFFSAEDYAAKCQVPLARVQEHWPRINEQFWHAGLTGKAVMIAAAATIPIETAHRFEPIHEFRMADGSIPPWWWTYDGGPEYHGRGFTQNTHKYNYAHLSTAVPALWKTDPNQADFQFVEFPDNLLQPDVSAAAMACFFRDRHSLSGDSIEAAAERGDWRGVRALVQGGDSGLQDFTRYALSLGGASEPVVDTNMAYGPDIPDSVILQKNNWTCAARSTYAALWAMAAVGQGDPVTYGDEGPRDVYEWLVPDTVIPGVGLELHTGETLAQELQARGYNAHSKYPVSLDRVRQQAGRVATLIGGDDWNHWAYVRGKTADGGLVVENPSPGHGGITDYIRDSWARLGPFAMVWIEPTPVEPQQPTEAPTAEHMATLVGLAYNEDGVVLPPLDKIASGKPTKTEMAHEASSVASWLRANRPK